MIPNRLKGIVERLKIAGIDVDQVPIIESPYEFENGAHAFRQLMDNDARPTVVMCGNDVLAVGAIQAAKEMGIAVPADVSITGFDGIEIANIVTPKLTTVHVPHAEMGRRAADELVRMVEQSTMGTSFELQSSLRLEASLAPPRDDAE